MIHTAETGSSTILETLFMENVVQDAVLTGDSGGTGTGATVSVERYPAMSAYNHLEFSPILSDVDI